MDVPENAPEHCPGTASESAGKATPCQGCPNRQICASGGGKTGEDPALDEIRQRMASVKHKILILSGKGGVGKSTFSVSLARALSDNSSEQRQVALLDIDICGPSQPKMLGLEGEQVHQSMSGWSPIYAEENLCLMSVGFLLGSAEEAVVWRGPKKNGLIKQFLKDVDWGDIDYMIIDTPPGTSDEHLSIVQFLMNTTNVDGAVLITTPQEIAIQDVRKEANFCRKVKLPIIGAVENMSLFVCPKCKKESTIFSATNGGGEAFCKQMQINFLGSVPLDPRLAKCCDEGRNFLELFGDTNCAKAIRNVTEEIITYCEKV